MEEISLHLLDVCQNSLKANATLIQILVTEDPTSDILSIDLIDDGDGMSSEIVQRVSDPFYTTRTTRKVGLGISFFKMSAEATNGHFIIESQEGVGTKIHATFHKNHIDCIPMGEIEDTLIILALNDQATDIYYHHAIGKVQFEFDTRAIKDILKDTPFTEPGVIEWMKEYIKEGMNNIHKEETK